MNRRALVSAFGAALLTPSVIVAEQATPVSGETKYIGDFLGGVTRPNRVGFRSFDVPNPGIFGEGLGWFVAYGMKFRDITAAQEFAMAFPKAFSQWDLLDRDPPLEGSTLRMASVRKIGDQNWATTYTVTDTAADRSFERGVAAIRKATWLQIMVGSAFAGSTIVALSDIAEKTLSRWPNKAVSSVKDGLNAGDIFATLPVLMDVPEGVSVDDDNQINF